MELPKKKIQLESGLYQRDEAESEASYIKSSGAVQEFPFLRKAGKKNNYKKKAARAAQSPAQQKTFSPRPRFLR